MKSFRKLFFNHTLNFNITITEMYPRIPGELVADPFVSAEHILGTIGLQCKSAHSLNKMLNFHL
jgi:hypothetical protein